MNGDITGIQIGLALEAEASCVESDHLRKVNGPEYFICLERNENTPAFQGMVVLQWTDFVVPAGADMAVVATNLHHDAPFLVVHIVVLVEDEPKL